MIGAITPCLWFDGYAEEAALFYTSVFKKSKIKTVSRYTNEGVEIHGQKDGTVMVVEFIINGQTFTALNGGPQFRFNESISMQVYCESQQEIDYFWERFGKNGGREGQCGWIKDKFGISWQIIPAILPKLMSNPLKAAKATQAFMQMKKFDIEKLIQACE